MAGTQAAGPTPETKKLAERIAKMAGKKGVALSAVVEKTGKTPSVVRTALRAGEKLKLLKRQGKTSATRYFAA